MNELSSFTSAQFGTVRTVIRNGEPWFIGKDVAASLGYRETAKAIREHVDPDDKGVSVLDTPGGMQQMTVINESGMYSLILSSKLPSARQFKRWVTHDVLPAIRSRGLYATPDAITSLLSDPQALIAVLNQLSTERSARIAAEQSRDQARTELATVREELRRTFPSTVYISSTDPDAGSCVSIGALAREFHLAQRTMFSYLRDLGYIQPNSPLPTHDGLKSGFFLIMDHASGSTHYYTAAVTLAGRLHFDSIF